MRLIPGVYITIFNSRFGGGGAIPPPPPPANDNGIDWFFVL